MKTTCIFSIIIVMILFSLRSNAQNWDQIVKASASDRNAQDYYGKSVAIDGDFAIVGAWGQDKDASGGGTTLLEAGAAYILQNTGGTWVEIQKVVASDRGAGDNFGYSVDINGDYAVVGAWKEDHDAVGTDAKTDAGSAYVFYNNAGTWTEVQKIVASDRFDGDYFGQSVAIDGDFIVVGAFNEDEDVSGANNLTSAGSMYVFKNNGTNWTQTQKIVASDRATQNYFGFSIDLWGNYIIAGAYNKHENTFLSAGAAYVFYYNGSTWSQISKLLAPVPTTQSFFGYDVAINDNFAVVGARGEDENEFITNTGAAYIYSNPGAGTALSFSSKIAASDQLSNDNFGCSVDIDENYIVVGAYNHSLDENGLNLRDFAGAAYIYHYDEFEWTQEQKIVNLDRNIVDYFAYDVSISNNFIIAGAMYQDFDADGQNERPEAGAAYIFHNCREIFVYQDTTEIEKKGTFDFGHIEIGSSSPELIFTIENTGMDNLILDGIPIIEIYGTNATDFALNQSATSSPVIPGGTTTFTIIFTPSFIGLHTAEIKISNNDYDENPFVFTIIGIGAKIPQTISEFNPIDVKTYGDDDFIVSATASSGLDVIFTSSDNNIAICGGTNGSNITITGVGSCEIYANQPGNGIYLAAPQDSQTLIVNKKIITVTADAGQTKDYGEIDPVLTYTVSPEGLETGDDFSGALTRVAGETVGLYEILIGDLSAGPNYEISFITDDFAIIERTIYVTADVGQSKIYGQSDPTLTYSYYPNIIDGDAFSGSIIRVSGENIGNYEIQQGTLSLNSNYIIDFISNDFEIIAKTITITPNSTQSKTYGTTDPSAFVYSIYPALVQGDTFTGALERVAGEDVGFYAITLGTLDAGDNYILTFVDEVFEIIARPITIVVYPDQSKLYGDTDPTFAYWLMGTLANEDELTGELSRAPGESLGFYAITQGTLSLGSNYNLNFTAASFEIKVKGLSVQVDPNQSKEYGDDDPVFTYTINSSLALGDNFTGELARVPGEDVGAYMITQGSLALNSNYSIVFMEEEFEITRKIITVTVDPNQSKYYGEPNPDAYTYSYTGTLQNGDGFSGNLERQSGEDVGTYNILQASLWVNPNYQIIYNDDVFEILHEEISVFANAGQTKTYGDANPTEYTYTYTGDLFIFDIFTGELTREAGENVGNYEIQQGSLSLNNNYNITYYPNNFEITQKPINVTADANQSKVFGEDDPTEFTYTVLGSLIGGDSFTGELTRETGDNVGFYQILQGNLNLNNNYAISYISDNFEITKATPIITWENPADIYYGTELTENQLNASANISGNFYYIPDFSTILEVGDNQALNVEFIPDNYFNYNNANATAYINVLLNSNITEYRSSIEVYPNPAKDYVNIMQGNTLFKHLKVYDITGKIVIEQNLDALITCLDISNLPSGVYFIALKTDNSSAEIRVKLVKTDNY